MIYLNANKLYISGTLVIHVKIIWSQLNITYLSVCSLVAKGMSDNNFIHSLLFDMTLSYPWVKEDEEDLNKHTANC